MIKNKYNLLQSINWALKPNVCPSLITTNRRYTKEERLKANKLEKEWGCSIIEQTNNNQWTTKLGEHLVKNVYLSKGIFIKRPIQKNGYRPDWETENEIIEVKTRSWTTSGTAGEKVLGVPYKYSDIPRIYNKPLKIVCVAYQEYELTYGNTQIFGTNISDEKKQMLELWKNMGIEFIPFSKLVESTLQ